jgi:DNA gyrase subunit A
LFFSNRGKVYRLKAHQIPMTSRTARGTAIVNLLQLQPEETIRAIIDTRDYETNRYLFFATKLGRVKKTQFTAYDSSLKAGLIAIKLNDDDELMDVIPLNDEEDVFLVSQNGQTIRFDEGAVRPMGRTAAGVRGMKFRSSDELVACARAQDDTRLLIITSEGYGKQSELDQYPIKGRGGLGVRGIRVNDKKGKVVAAFMVGEGEEIMLIGDGGTLIRTAVDNISIQGRDASGVRVMNVTEGHQVAAVARVLASDEEDGDDGLIDGGDMESADEVSTDELASDEANTTEEE